MTGAALGDSLNAVSYTVCSLTYTLNAALLFMASQIYSLQDILILNQPYYF